MIRFTPPTTVRWGSAAVTLLALFFLASPARAQSAQGQAADTVGRVEFDFPDAPAATVEVDLTEGMLSAFAGVGKAAIQGAIEGLSREEQPDSAVQQSAEHLQAVNDVFEIASSVIREVRVRVYSDLSARTQDAHAAMVGHYQEKLDGTNWDNVVKVHDGGTNVVVCVLEEDGAIRGAFVIVSEQDDLVMVNVVCELTPDKVRQVTSQATQIGMKVGLEEVIEQAIRQIDQRHH